VTELPLLNLAGIGEGLPVCVAALPERLSRIFSSETASLLFFSMKQAIAVSDLACRCLRQYPHWLFSTNKVEARLL